MSRQDQYKVVRVDHDLDDKTLKELTDKLRELSGNKADTYIMRAVNKTAVSARQRLSVQARNVFTFKKAGDIKKSIWIKNASLNGKTATLDITGKMLNIEKFKYAKNTKHLAARVDLVRTGYKPLGIDGNKAFILRQQKRDGGTANLVFSRTNKTSTRGKHLPINIIKAKPMAYIIGSNRVYGNQEDIIRDDLKKFMGQQIDMLLKRKAK